MFFLSLPRVLRLGLAFRLSSIVDQWLGLIQLSRADRFPIPMAIATFEPCTLHFRFLGLMFPGFSAFFGGFCVFLLCRCFLFWGILGTRCIFTASSWPQVIQAGAIPCQSNFEHLRNV